MPIEAKLSRARAGRIDMMQNGPITEAQRADAPPMRVLLCPDQPDWAFDNIANNIIKHARTNWVSKMYMRDTIDNEHVFFRRILTGRIDVCHVFWREDLFYLLRPETIAKAAARLGLTSDLLTRAINSCVFTTSIYDHLFDAPDQIAQRRAGFARVDGYSVSSLKLRDIYESQQDLPPPDIVITDGVDIDRFSPAPTRTPGAVARIGWVGNSAWGRQAHGTDIKGYHRLFSPMMEVLTARGITVEANVADPQIRRIPFSEMPDFYRSNDVFVCTSSMEGTPNPVLEAMACGIPIVSTDVGIVPEVFGDLQRRFIFTHPTPASFADAVATLLADPPLRRMLAEENRARAIEWSWEGKTNSWWPFWRNVLTRSADPRNAIRRELCLRLADD